MSKLKPCQVTSCLRPAASHGLCTAHHDRLTKSGNLKVNQPILALNVRKSRGAIARILSHVRP